MQIARALEAIGGESADRASLELADRLPPWEQMNTRLRAGEVDIDEMADRLISLNLVTAEESKEALISAREQTEKEWGDNADSSIILLELLTAAGIMVWFDVETDQIPVRHDKLLQEFAAASKGLFTPEATYEKMVRSNPDDWEGPYTVQFIFNDRLYRFEARNFGDWYDAERVVTTIHKALSEAGLKERFVPLLSQGQDAMFVFGKPQTIHKLATSLYLPLDTDLQRAMDLGKAYEAEVLKELE